MLQGHQPATVDVRTPVAKVAVDLALGQISALEFRWDNTTVSPLHFAPWRDEPEIQSDHSISLLERRLGGDFFCMPFGANDVEPAPAHGWSASSPWRLKSKRVDGLDMVLERRVFGAEVEKRVTLGTNSPVLYQEHIITGGTGKVTFAHHPMVHFQTRARLSVSPKARVVTGDQPLDAGRERLSCGVDQADLTALPAVDGGVIDPFALPIGERHEDFLVMVESPANELGWTALVRETEDDIVFILKNPEVLPVTMFWHSNGGRDYAPWSGRHRNVLGIEDGCAAGAGGHKLACGDNPLTRPGTRTCIELAGGESHRIRHVIAAIPRPAGWSEIAAISLQDNSLVLSERDGATKAIPFQIDFFQGVR